MTTKAEQIRLKAEGLKEAAEIIYARKATTKDQRIGYVASMQVLERVIENQMAVSAALDARLESSGEDSLSADEFKAAKAACAAMLQQATKMLAMQTKELRKNEPMQEGFDRILNDLDGKYKHRLSLADGEESRQAELDEEGADPEEEAKRLARVARQKKTKKAKTRPSPKKLSTPRKKTTRKKSTVKKPAAKKRASRANT